VQPDRGALCTYWIAALVSALGDKDDRSCIECKIYALQALEATVFIYTGHAIPRPLRAPLMAALSHQLTTPASKRDGGGMLLRSARSALHGLLWLLHTDDAFAEHVRALDTLIKACAAVR
jgi:hypothetical protein